jgi:glutathionylspermidine synthase
MTYHTHEGEPYWFESAYYEFTLNEVNELESATNEVYRLCLEAVESIVQLGDYDRLKLPEEIRGLVEESWEDDDYPTLYGRFDFSFSGGGKPKLLEFNADTPTALLEAAVIQWKWKEELFPEADQFNSIWEGLVETWEWFKDQNSFALPLIHFTSVQSDEDLMTVTLLRDAAEAVGLMTDFLYLEDIGFREATNSFVDLAGRPIRTLFKLYPWEWLIDDEFGVHAMQGRGQVKWIEPAWKAILSSKAILPILWELFPGHPNLLPAFFDDPNGMSAYAKKPIFSREGANVTLVGEGDDCTMEGPYGEEGYIYQALAPLPRFNGARPVIGSWVIGGESRGIGVRESDGPITDNLSRFVPHLFWA